MPVFWPFAGRLGESKSAAPAIVNDFKQFSLAIFLRIIPVFDLADLLCHNQVSAFPQSPSLVLFRMSTANLIPSIPRWKDPPYRPAWYRVFAVGLGMCLGSLGGLLQDSPARADWLELWLAGGRVAPAVEQARRLPDPREATTALRRIAAHQRARGQVDAADRTLRYIPDHIERNRERELGVRHPPEKPRSGGGGGSQPGTQGGASVTDFTELIDLITSTVSPSSWETLGGVGSVRPFVSGVYVDPRGLVQNATERIAEFPLQDLLQPAHVLPLEEVAQATVLRVISLRRLEQSLATRLENGLLPTDVMRNLAGITRLDAVVLQPDDSDILLLGPASGWKYNSDGRAVSTTQQSPILLLDDLILLLQSARVDHRPGVFGCSINTRDSNLAELRDFVEQSNRGGPLAPGQLRRWLRELQRRLGRQDVVIQGIPPDSRVAQVLVAADYRMKLIGVGQVDGGAKIPDYFALLRRARLDGGPPLEALRWWLTMGDRQIIRNPDRTVFQWRGPAVLAQSENQFIAARGQRIPTGVAEPINQEFAENLTRHFDELAKRDVVFGDLRNVFDMALATTVMQTEDWWRRCQWDGGLLRRPGVYPLEVLPVPREVESVVAHRVHNQRQIVVQVAGGVQVDLPAVLKAAREETTQFSIPQLPKESGITDNWWWDPPAR